MADSLNGRQRLPAKMERCDFARFRIIPPRWMDKDGYRHVNNVACNSFFDTAVDRVLIEAGLLDVSGRRAIGVVIETGCQSFAPIVFLDEIDAGVRVAKIGRSGVRCELGLFRGDDEVAVAAGHFIHMHADRETDRAVSIPENARPFPSTLRAATMP